MVCHPLSSESGTYESLLCVSFFFDSSELGLQAPRLAATSRAVVPSAGRSAARAPGSATKQ